MKLIKEPILNKIQVAAEVNAALNEHNLVLVTKGQGDAPVYRIYAAEVADGTFTLQCELENGQLQEL